MEEAPRRLGRYEILRELGRGGMASVYLARQLDLDRLVALKELSAFHAADPAFAERFLRESRVAGSLTHQNIVTVYDYFEHGDVAYISMEYLERGSLRPWIADTTTPRAAGVLEGVLAGLAYAESRHIVHRDLKPENLMITVDGRVKIADFGIAKALDRAATLRHLTATGTAVGTPAYMAPEQAMAKELSSATDLYSLGIIAYEMLVGRLPFEETDTPLALLLQHVNERVPPPLVLRPDLDPAIASWLEWMLAKDPADRPPSAAEAWEALEDVVLRICGPRWRRSARLLVEGRSQRVPQPLTPAPFGESPEQDHGTSQGSDSGGKPTDFVTFDPRRRAGSPARMRQPAASPGPAVPAPRPAAPAPQPARPPAPSAVLPPIESPPASPAEGSARRSHPSAEPAQPVDPQRSVPGADGVEAPTIPPRARAPADAAGAVAPRSGDARQPGPNGRARTPAAWRRRTASVGGVVVALVLLAAAGYLIGGSGGGGTPTTTATRTASNGDLEIPFPSTWRRGGKVTIPGLELTRPIALTAPDPHEGGMLAGRTGGSGPTLLPAAFRKHVERIGDGVPVRLGSLQALRRDGLEVEAVPTPVTVYAAPTDRGVATIVCYGGAVARKACDQIAARTRLLRGRPLALGPGDAFARSLGDAVARLERARVAAERMLARARRPDTQARALREHSRAYASAARRVRRISVGPRERDANGDVAMALSRASAAYAALERSARDADRMAYVRRRRVAQDRVVAVHRALRAMTELGYRVKKR